jgi:hypothetical protein
MLGYLHEDLPAVLAFDRYVGALLYSKWVATLGIHRMYREPFLGVRWQRSCPSSRSKACGDCPAC